MRMILAALACAVAALPAIAQDGDREFEEKRRAIEREFEALKKNLEREKAAALERLDRERHSDRRERPEGRDVWSAIERLAGAIEELRAHVRELHEMLRHHRPERGPGDWERPGPRPDRGPRDWEQPAPPKELMERAEKIRRMLKGAEGEDREHLLRELEGLERAMRGHRDRPGPKPEQDRPRKAPPEKDRPRKEHPEKDRPAPKHDRPEKDRPDRGHIDELLRAAKELRGALEEAEGEAREHLKEKLRHVERRIKEFRGGEKDRPMDDRKGRFEELKHELMRLKEMAEKTDNPERLEEIEKKMRAIKRELETK